MSAFIVDAITIDRIVTHIVSEMPEFAGINTSAPNAANDIGAMLYKLNTKSVNSRYNEKAKAPKYTYKRAFSPSPVQTFKSIRCFLYQSCESDACIRSKAYKALDALSSEIAQDIVNGLPEYARADWG
jgi:hypothetical protein